MADGTDGPDVAPTNVGGMDEGAGDPAPDGEQDAASVSPTVTSAIVGRILHSIDPSRSCVARLSRDTRPGPVGSFVPPEQAA